MKKGLYIVATPIGNLGDICQRAIDTLSNADIIACEDKRVSKKLFSLLGISTKKTFINVCDYNEKEAAAQIIEYINKENSVALVSDAGSPLISDPGYKLIKECKEQQIYITTIPGPSALICALQLAGLPTDKFLFAGFVPNKQKAKEDFFAEYKNLKATIICYEASNRIIKTLETIKKIFNNPDISVVREITKMYEEAITNNVDALITHFTNHPPKGEMVLLINQKEVANNIDIKKILTKELKTKKLKEAVKDIVETYGLNKNEVYKKALEIKNEG